MHNPSINANPSRELPAAPRVRRGHGRTTMREVASAAGVTAITVSRYLREPERVAPATALRIAAVLQQSGYVPNKQAGQLAGGASRMVAAIIPSISNSIFAETVQGLADTFAAAGHELLLASTNYSPQREEEQIRAVLGWFPCALVVTGHHHTDGALALLRAARDRGTPVVEVWDRSADGVAPEFAQVGFNHGEVGAAMAAHLLGLGHRRLAWVDSAVLADVRARARGDGFVAAVRAAGARVRRLTAAPGDAFDAGRGALDELLRQPVRSATTAAAFANDLLGCGALLAANAAGIDVPGRIALLGFGDFAIGRQLTPMLSTVRPPRYEIGREAALRLLHALRSRSAPEAQTLGWELLPRGSTLRVA